MGRQPSEKTQLATARRNIRFFESQMRIVKAEREQYRIRATKAEQELADWKARFDNLLKMQRRDHSARGDSDAA